MLKLPLLNIVASFLVAGFITWYSIPKIIKVIRIKNLYDKPGDRKIHKGNIPTLGGIGIFGGFFISMLLFVNGYVDHLSMVCASLMFIFFMGEKDDLINMPPKKKLMIEIAAASLLAIGTDLRISSLHGILGIDLLPVWVSIILTVFVIIFVMNAFNLIDGIDGLAAGIGIFASVLYGICFWLAGDTGYAVMCAAIAGALCAFLPYNFDKGKLKIFMGDTGSLTVGFLLAIITIRFNENSVNNIAAYNFISTPAISLSILILPLYDTVRVFVIRIIQKKNPFKGDNNHLHHRLIRFGYTHMQATIIFLAFSSLLVILALSINHLGTNLVSVVVIFFSAVLSYGSFRLENRMLYRKQKNYPVLNNLSYKKTG